jgi:signal transduction histidine kinase
VQPTLASLPTHHLCIDVSDMAEEVQFTFDQDLDLPGIIIVDADGKLLGMISRDRFMELFNKPYRKELFQKRALQTLVRYDFNNPLCLDDSVTIDQAARLALARPAPHTFDPIVSKTASEQLGVIDTRILLMEMAKNYEHQFNELKSTQSNLIRAEKMASLGNLVAGVAHEINTPIGIGVTAMSYFLDYARAFRESFASGVALKKTDLVHLLNKTEECGNLVLTNLDRASELIRSFKQVAVDSSSQVRRSFDLEQNLQDIMRSLQPRIKRTHMRIEWDTESGIIMESFPGALAQIITNLVMNALDHAFEEGKEGILKITAKAVGEHFVNLEVRDNGRGIAPEHLGSIFDPFFTTRRGQGGSGLGLHIVYNLVLGSLGGALDVQSTLGEGTVFTLYIPRTAPQTPGTADNFTTSGDMHEHSKS